MDIEDVVQRAMRKEFELFRQDIMKMLDEKFNALNKRIVDQDKCIESLKNENIELHKQLDVQASRLDEFETHTRMENLIIKGIPEQTYAERAAGSTEGADGRTPVSSQQAAEAAVITFCHDKLNLSLSPQDISSAHCIKKGPKDGSRPILVWFSS